MTILTPPVISKLPLGLLGFFGIKNGGQYPQTLGNQISPTLEQLGILAANYHTNHAYIAAPIAAGWTQATVAIAGVPQRVPAGELWYISSCSMHLSSGAGDAIVASPAVRGTQFGAAAAFYRVLAPPFTLAASQNIMRPCDQYEFWMEPNDELGFWAESVTSVTGLLVVIEVKVTRFPF